MREELNVNDMSQVAGGKVYVNSRTRKVGFTSIQGVFPIKDGANPYLILELCDSMIGQYPTDAEYDAACFKELKKRNWI